ncbi:hypothetical protein AB0B10_24945 [Micromonospora arborensis]|uniref:hypothetical protein n=1 Tax=Micromonospora arborensis TaxID=2116518 RepID=UPI0033E563F8
MRRRAAGLAAVAVLAGCSASPARPPGASLAPSAASGVRIEGTLSPHRAVVVEQTPDPAQLPPAGACAEALTVLTASGARIADAGLLTLSISTARRAQVRIDRVKVRVVSEPAPTFAASARCGFTDRREQNIDRPERYGAQTDVTIAENNHEVAWVTASGLLSGVEYDEYFQGPPGLYQTPLDLTPGQPQILPMYVANSDSSVRQGFLVDVYLAINGRQHAVTVTDHGSPFWVYGTAGSALGEPTTEYLEDTRRWRGGGSRGGEVATRPIPQTRPCLAVTPDELKSLLGSPIWVDGGGESCNWRNPKTDEHLTLNLSTPEDPQESFLNRVAALPVTYPDEPLVHVSDVGGEAINIGPFILARSGREYAELSLSTNEPSLDQYAAAARTIAGRLWTGPYDSPAMTTADFAGEWHVHGANLTLRKNATGVTVWNAGPCSPRMGETRLCSGRAEHLLRLQRNFAILTTTKVVYVDEEGQTATEYEPGGDGPVAGDVMYLHRLDDGVLAQLSDGQQPGNPYLCGQDANDFWTKRCGG